MLNQGSRALGMVTVPGPPVNTRSRPAVGLVVRPLRVILGTANLRATSTERIFLRWARLLLRPTLSRALSQSARDLNGEDFPPLGSPPSSPDNAAGSVSASVEGMRITDVIDSPHGLIRGTSVAGGGRSLTSAELLFLCRGQLRLRRIWTRACGLYFGKQGRDRAYC
jgi:hypothetical protein